MSTSFYAGVLAIIYVGLSLYVVQARVKFRVGIGDGGNPKLSSRIRQHGNFSEYVPFALFITYLNEVSNAPLYLINIFGCALIVGRLLHAYGLGKTHGESPGRFIGTLLTFGVLVIGGIRLILVNLS